MSLIPISTQAYTAELVRQEEYKKALLKAKQERDNPGLSQAAADGWELQPDGKYKRTFNGITQETTSGNLVSQYESKKHAEALSNPATIGGNTDYVGQLKALLGERQQSAGASSVPLTNPYEQRLQELMSNPDSIANTNAYRFRFNEGQQALERSAAAKGMLRSGNTLAALANYGQGAASQEYGNEVSRLGALTGQQNQYNLGRMGLANQEQSNAESAWQNRAGTALSALIAGNRDKLATNELAATNAVRTGYINPGSTGRASTW